MKKYFFLFLVLLLTGIMTACAGNAASSVPSPSESVSAPASSTPAEPGGASDAESTAEVSADVSGENRKDTSSAKVLVVYFSRTGNTQAVAEQIAELTDGDLFEIQTAAAYPAEYEAATEVAKKEQNEKARPELSTALENLADYSTVFIGYPIWWGDMPMAVYSFLDTYDFSGKTVLPFCTHGGSGLSGTDANIQEKEPNAAVATALAISGSGAADSKQAVTDWLKSTGNLAE